jgi:hypothetical protein
MIEGKTEEQFLSEGTTSALVPRGEESSGAALGRNDSFLAPSNRIDRSTAAAGGPPARNRRSASPASDDPFSTFFQTTKPNCVEELHRPNPGDSLHWFQFDQARMLDSKCSTTSTFPPQSLCPPLSLESKGFLFVSQAEHKGSASKIRPTLDIPLSNPWNGSPISSSPSWIRSVQWDAFFDMARLQLERGGSGIERMAPRVMAPPWPSSSVPPRTYAPWEKKKGADIA